VYVINEMHKFQATRSKFFLIIAILIALSMAEWLILDRGLLRFPQSKQHRRRATALDRSWAAFSFRADRLA
jgi:hypothetical protein